MPYRNQNDNKNPVQKYAYLFALERSRSKQAVYIHPNFFDKDMYVLHVITFDFHLSKTLDNQKIS